MGKQVETEKQQAQIWLNGADIATSNIDYFWPISVELLHLFRELESNAACLSSPFVSLLLISCKAMNAIYFKSHFH